MGCHNRKIYYGPSADSNSQCLDQKTPVLINGAITAQKNSGGILRLFHSVSLEAYVSNMYMIALIANRSRQSCTYLIYTNMYVYI